tara:strand:+ start:374 stop:1627 length:1254 start_codon:yes stop_codon:yes gene_type:complete
MRFTDLASIHEGARLGSKFRLPAVTKEESVTIHSILFANETLTRRKILSMVAKQLEVPYDVLASLDDNTVALLASESSASNQSTWTLNDALTVRDAVVSGTFDYLSLSKQMNEIDARLFWSSVLGDRTVTPFVFLKSIAPDMSPDVVSSSRTFLTDMEVLYALYDDRSKLLDPKKWQDKPNAALRPRRWLPWKSNAPVEMTHYQEIPKRRVTLDYDEVNRVVVEKVGEHVTDVAYPDEPELGLLARLKKYSENSDELISWPQVIPSWESIIKKEGTIRFPNLGAFAPDDYGGYVLIKKSHIHALRLSEYRHVDSLELKLQAADGIDEYIPVGVCGVYIVSKMASLQFDLQRILGSNTNEKRQWYVIPEDKCVVVEVASPFLDRRTGELSQPVFMGLNGELGVSDITQYVDLVGVNAD